MSSGTGRERLTRGLEALCVLLDRHLPLMLASDEAFHQPEAPDQPSDYLHPFIQFLGEGTRDGSLAVGEDVVRMADMVFNAVAWPYVHLRGRHGWEADEARERLVGLVLNGIVGAGHSRKEQK